MLCDVPMEGVASAVDADNIYEIPLVLPRRGLDEYVCRLLHFDGPEHTLDISPWEAMVDRIEAATTSVRIGVIGKYVNLPDAYLSVVEALRHAGFHHRAKVEIEWVQAEEVTGMLAGGRLQDLDGIVIPGGFGERGVEGKVAAAGYAREHRIPCLGLCLGLQAMVIELSRNVALLAGANSREIDTATPHPVIDLMDEQAEGDRPRWGPCGWVPTSPASIPEPRSPRAYGEPVVSERHRHRYEVNPRYRLRLEEAGPGLLRHLSGRPAGRVRRAPRAPVLGGNPGPPRSSRAGRTGRIPSSASWSGAALSRARGRAPRLLDLDAVKLSHRGRRSAGSTSGLRYQGSLITVATASYSGPDGEHLRAGDRAPTRGRCRWCLSSRRGRQSCSFASSGTRRRKRVLELPRRQAGSGR